MGSACSVIRARTGCGVLLQSQARANTSRPIKETAQNASPSWHPHLQQQAQQSESRARTLAAENAAAKAQLSELQRDFSRLLRR